MAFSFRAGTNWCHDFPKLARESGFHFNMHRRRVRVDWNRISSIDIDRVVGERDFSTIDENVNNVVDYCLESEYDVKILDPNFVKLFRLAQLAVEYLLYCKQYLDHSVVILKDELKCKLEENLELKKELGANEKIIKELKDKLKERSKIIETKLSDSHGEIHKCPQCPKTFISALFMNAHVNRRHPNLSRMSPNSPMHDQYRAETEKLHSEIKSLKERLNLTERVIRNESEKFLSSDSVLSNDNRETKIGEKNEAQNRRERDEIMEEHHRRYQEEIGNLKATLFDEIRNLKFGERYQRGKSDTEDCNNVGVKELIREQENEIKRLRRQLSAKQSSPKIEERDTDTKRENQEIVWQSKFENLETCYRADIEKLYSQLKMTQESADRMRVDYTTRISELEKREASVESALSQTRKFNQETRDSPKKYDFSSLKNHRVPREIDDENSEDSPNDPPIDLRISNTENVNDKVTRKSSANSKSLGNTRRVMKEEEIEFPRSNRYKRKNKSGSKSDFHENLRNGEMKNPRDKSLNSEFRERSAIKVQSKSVEPCRKKIIEEIPKRKNFLSVKEREEKFVPIEKAVQAIPEKVERSLENKERLESVSEEEDSESWLDSESEEDSSETDEKKEENKEEGEEESLERDLELSEDGLEIFNARLRELGIDPEWRGIPDATFSQVLEILSHHRNINSKKYRKFEDIRRKLVHQLTRRLAIKEKKEKIDDVNERSQLGRLVTNVKSKVSKALDILEKNDGSYGSRSMAGGNRLRRFEEEDRISGEKSTSRIEIEAKKLSQPRESPTSEDSYENLSKRTERYVNLPTKDISGDLNQEPKQLSHSYESIKDFIRDTNPRQAKSIFNVSGTLVASTPQKIATSDSSKSVNETPSHSAIRATKRNDKSSNQEVDSPRNNGKSVLKSTTVGSVGSLTKKKVLFDLESSETRNERRSMYPTHEEEINIEDDKETSESEFDVSSIREEREDDRINNSNQSSRSVLLRTSQSEKIAQISRDIEKQLSLARRKPAGSIEAMFLEKFSLGNDKEKLPIDVYPSFTSSIKSDKEKSLDPKLPQKMTPDLQNHDSLFSKTHKRDDERNDEDLEMDIDELLKIE